MIICCETTETRRFVKGRETELLALLSWCNVQEPTFPDFHLLFTVRFYVIFKKHMNKNIDLLFKIQISISNIPQK